MTQSLMNLFGNIIYRDIVLVHYLQKVTSNLKKLLSIQSKEVFQIVGGTDRSVNFLIDFFKI